ncbi:transposase [Lysinibacillus sp. FJAT-14745]|uniref:IS110 family transposase n=1 Tax=Lysinibacillus sp. FJAT-14745 TaxID=1704289 RepID=UPI0006AB9AC0|nr:IS110 family transposase [Lysinibacillus sp. FJAT-14745]KOP69420.1 transposase [Lysinibacillus sp. FJAT-14745]
MHERQKHVYVGVDLHKQHHVAVIINCWQEKLDEIKFENKPSAFSTFLRDIYKHMDDGLTPIFGLEDVGGYGRALAKYLADHEQILKEVNPALSYAERKSHMTTQKSDSWDAECVARILVNKLEQLPDAKPHDLYWSIQQLVTRRNALVKAQGALKNQLHIQLSHHYPSYRKFFSEVDGKLLDFQLDTMPGIDLVTASALIAEIGDVRRFPNANKLARFAGIAPVYFGSGGKGREQKSKQGNRALHALFYNLAVQQVQVAKGSKLPRNPVFHAYYQRKLKEGKTKGQALVCIMRRLVNVIYGMMKHKTAYELPIIKEEEVV